MENGEKHSEIIQKLMVATNKIDGVYYYFAKRLGLKENEFFFLYALSDGKPHTQKEICDLWLIPKTTLNTVVRGLSPSGVYPILRRRTFAGKENGADPVGKAVCGRCPGAGARGGKPGDDKDA